LARHRPPQRGLNAASDEIPPISLRDSDASLALEGETPYDWGPAMSERDIFDAAREMTDLAARSAYLDGACGGDAGLRSRVEALLRAHDGPDSLLDRPTLAQHEHDPATDRTVAIEGGEAGHDEVPLGFLSPA